jgi:acetyl/propionyl-CoA carboxylase alpha subunit
MSSISTIATEQLRVAFGEALSVRQGDVRLSGAAIDARIKAEDPDFHFMGSLGTITHRALPGGPFVRVDSGVTAGSVVQPYYDSMLVKIMTYDGCLHAIPAGARLVAAARYDASTLESEVLRRSAE